MLDAKVNFSEIAAQIAEWWAWMQLNEWSYFVAIVTVGPIGILLLWMVLALWRRFQGRGGREEQAEKVAMSQPVSKEQGEKIVKSKKRVKVLYVKYDRIIPRSISAEDALPFVARDQVWYSASVGGGWFIQHGWMIVPLLIFIATLAIPGVPGIIVLAGTGLVALFASRIWHRLIGGAGSSLAGQPIIIAEWADGQKEERDEDGEIIQEAIEEGWYALAHDADTQSAADSHFARQGGILTPEGLYDMVTMLPEREALHMTYKADEKQPFPPVLQWTGVGAVGLVFTIAAFQCVADANFGANQAAQAAQAAAEATATPAGGTLSDAGIEGQ